VNLVDIKPVTLIIQQWASLLFQMAFSGSVTFLLVCGGQLVAGLPLKMAIGSAMVACAVVLAVLFRRSPLTKGMMVVLPSEEAAKEIAASLQTISK
jgi:hypothetical protein